MFNFSPRSIDNCSPVWLGFVAFVFILTPDIIRIFAIVWLSLYIVVVLIRTVVDVVVFRTSLFRRGRFCFFFGLFTRLFTRFVAVSFAWFSAVVLALCRDRFGGFFSRVFTWLFTWFFTGLFAGCFVQLFVGRSARFVTGFFTWFVAGFVTQFNESFT